MDQIKIETGALIGFQKDVEAFNLRGEVSRLATIIKEKDAKIAELTQPEKVD